jgi:hypothetical protein
MRIHYSVWQWEPYLGVVELLNVRSSAVLWFDDSNLHDLDGGRTSPVPCSHVTIALGDGPSDCQVAVFPVHVVCPAPRVVPQPNTNVLYLCR